MIFHHVNFASISSSIVFLSSFISIFFLFRSSYRKRTKRKWLFFSFFTGLWGFGATILFSTNDVMMALFFGRFINILQPLLIVTFLDFVRLFTRRFYIKINYFYIVSVLLLIAGIIFPDKCIPHCKIINNKFYYPTLGYILLIYSIFFISVALYGLFIMFFEIKQSKNVLKINQIKYILLGFFIGFLGSFTTFFYLFDINIYPFGIIFIPTYILIPMYAIINYNLMDLDVAWRKIFKEFFSFFIYFVFLFLIVFFSYNDRGIFVIISIIICIFLYYSKSKIDNFLYILFLGKYKTILEKLKLIKIKNILDKDLVLDILLKEIPKYINVKKASYYDLVDSNFVLTKSNFSYDETSKTNRISIKSLMVKYMLLEKTYIYLPKIITSKNNFNVVIEMKKLGIEFCYPFFIDGVFKSFLAYSKRDFVFNKEELDILSNIIRDAELEMNALITMNVKTKEVLEQYKTNQQMFFLEDIERLDEIQEILPLCMKSEKLINRILKTNTTSIFLYDNNKNIYYCETDYDKFITLKNNEYFIEYIKYRKDFIFYKDIYDWAKKIKSKELEVSYKIMEKIKSEIILPIVDDNNLIGFISVGKKINELEFYSQDDLFMLKVITNKIKNRFFHIFSLKKANYDVLTQLPNERFMRVRLRDEIIKSSNINRSFAVGMFDLDNFKGINDTFGHEEGDITLKTVSDVVLSLIRPSDEVFRKGGDEFILIIRDINLENLNKFIKRFDKSFKEHIKIKKLEEKYKRKVSISMGIFLYSNFDENSDKWNIIDIDRIIHMLINYADKALYNAKRNGKSKIIILNNFENIDK